MDIPLLYLKRFVVTQPTLQRSPTLAASPPTDRKFDVAARKNSGISMSNINVATQTPTQDEGNIQLGIANRGSIRASSLRKNPGFLMGRVSRIQFLGSGPDRGQSPVEWGEILYVRTSVRPSPPALLALQAGPQAPLTGPQAPLTGPQAPPAGPKPLWQAL